MKNTRLVLIALICFSFNGFMQDSYTRLKFSSPLMNNSALAGIRNSPELNLSFSHFYGYNRTYLDYNQYSNKLHGGVGVYFKGGRSEWSKSDFSNMGITYAYQNKINDKWNYSLGAGIDFAFSGGFSKDTTIINTYFDYQFGGLLYTKKFFLGLSANDLYKTYRSLNLTVGYDFKPFKNIDLLVTPTSQITLYGNTLSVSNLGLNIKYKKLKIGGGYARYNGFINAGYEFNKFAFNYSISSFSKGINKYTSHEFAIKFKLNNANQKSKSLRFNPNMF